MQFQVPQFIETEDKVVGPFTLRQFMYVAGAGLASAILYFTVTTWLWLILTLVLLGGAIGVAFVKVEGRPLGNIIFAAFGFYLETANLYLENGRATSRHGATT